MSNYRNHALRELRALGWNIKDRTDGPNRWAQENLLELLNVLAAQGHSGNSAPMIISMFAKLARFKPLSPLTGAPDEWREFDFGVQQNRRCGHVFRREDGVCYDINGIVLQERNGLCFTSRNSRVRINFPYMPTSRTLRVGLLTTIRIWIWRKFGRIVT